MGQDFEKATASPEPKRQASASRGKAINWTKEAVKRLLEEVLAQNPFAGAHRRDGTATQAWKNICKTLITARLIPEGKEPSHIQQQVNKQLEYAEKIANAETDAQLPVKKYDGELDELIRQVYEVWHAFNYTQAETLRSKCCGTSSTLTKSQRLMRRMSQLALTKVTLKWCPNNVRSKRLACRRSHEMQSRKMLR